MSEIDAELSLSQRAALYRKRALDALLHADTTKDERVRDAYFRLAQGWHSLATNIEDSLGLSTAPKPLTDFQTNREATP